MVEKFNPLTLSLLEDVVGHNEPLGSPCDAVPPDFIEEIFSGIGKSVIGIINSSLSSGVVPVSMQHAVGQTLANDSAKNVSLVLLDLTAAFDTVDHIILGVRLQHLVCICSSALKWFRSYLADRTVKHWWF